MQAGRNSIAAMLKPVPLPDAPDDATAVLADALAQAAEQAGGTASRDVVLGVFRRHLARIQHSIQDAFEHDQYSGLRAARALSALVDGLVEVLHAHTTAEGVLGKPEKLSIIATGGYGRGVLAPFSDIDLLFLTPKVPDNHALQIVEYMLYFLWDLGLKVGHATRSIDDCLAESAKDTTVRTSLLDARLLCGDPAFYAASQKRFKAACEDAGAAGYIAAKQAERDVRHRRYGDSPFMVEPNIKEGRGGLRDLQTLYWISRYVFDTHSMDDLTAIEAPGGTMLTETEAKHARRSWDFLWTVRFHLHYVPDGRRSG